MSSRGIESFLAPDEEIRFERHPLGWPPLTGKISVLYAGFLVLAALPALGGVVLSFTWQKVSVPVPIMLPALLLLALVEVVRFAAFRSRVYVVTSKRVLVLGGVLSMKLLGDVSRARIRGLQLLGTEPAIALEERKVLLSGLDAVDLETIRATLGDPPPPLLPPVKLSRRRRWRRPLGFLLAVLFGAFVELEGLIQRLGVAEFAATSAKVGTAVATAEAVICSLVAAETGETIDRRSGLDENHSPFVEEARYRSAISADLFRKKLVSAEVRCERSRSLIPVRPTVTVVPDPEGSENKRFLDELRIELERAGIEATWTR